MLYIPSGLYRNRLPAGRTGQLSGSSRSFLWEAKDWLDSKLNRFSRSKARLPIILAVVLLGLGLILGLNTLKSQGQVVKVGPSPLQVYYDNMVSIDKQLRDAEADFNLVSGGAPVVGDYNDRITPNNAPRFIRGSERMLTRVEGFLTLVYSLNNVVPAGAESHYSKLKLKLEEKQRYYARLKDGVSQKNEGRWKEAFSNAPVMKDANTAEEQALNDLQALVLRPVPATPKA